MADQYKERVILAASWWRDSRRWWSANRIARVIKVQLITAIYHFCHHGSLHDWWGEGTKTQQVRALSANIDSGEQSLTYIFRSCPVWGLAPGGPHLARWDEMSASIQYYNWYSDIMILSLQHLKVIYSILVKYQNKLIVCCLLEVVCFSKVRWSYPDISLEVERSYM